MENDNTSQSINLRPEQAAQLLGVKKTTIWAYLRQGILPHIRLNGRYYIRRDSLKQWLADRETGGVA